MVNAIVTEPGSKEALDYLGHPCRTTVAFEQFDYSVKEARKDTASHPKALGRQIGIALLELYERVSSAHDSVDPVIEALPGDSDSDGALAALRMAKEYNLRTVNEFCDLVGMVLLALERGGLHESSGHA